MIDYNIVITARQCVGQYLKSIREEKKLTYYAVAKLSGLTIEQVQSIERGNRAYTIDSLLKVMHALDVRFAINGKSFGTIPPHCA